MITEIDIGNFGSFSQFDWKREVRNGGNVHYFKRLNILYGRNYSGKTTLSRIFRALELRKTPPNIPNSSFVVTGESGVVTQSTLRSHAYEVRVYNRDFVLDNLGFLVNQVDGEIKTFAIVGDANKEIDDAIAALKSELGDVESQRGLRYSVELKRAEATQADKNLKSAAASFDDKLRTHANNKIKKDRDYGDPLYNIDAIRRDLDLIEKQGFTPLSSEEKLEKLALLKQQVLPKISDELSVALTLDKLLKKASPLLSKEISPTVPIRELLDEPALQLWVKEGIAHHRDKRHTCAFCRQHLPAEIWQVLDSHFSKEATALETDIDAVLLAITAEKTAISNIRVITSDQIYPTERQSLKKIANDLSDALSTYKQDLDRLEAALKARKANLFEAVPGIKLDHDADAIQQHVSAINELIAISEGRSITLENDKEAARVALRLTDVHDFSIAVDCPTERLRIRTLGSERDVKSAELRDLEGRVQGVEERIESLRSQQKDERHAATRVNSLLNSFFGHDRIKLETKDGPGEAGVKFEVIRNGSSAYNLSEGECSLIAFCYFIAKLEADDSKGKPLIIYIDDPISSLDSNHVFFMFSLIESLITRPIRNADGSNDYRYKQLFISTHNLEFLKYLKRLSIPKKKIALESGSTKVADSESFMIQHDGAKSAISPMPSYLRDYITEFHYLFHQIYKCRDPANAALSHEPFFSFGNNLRKFLEVYLFFKFPYQDDRNDGLERVRRFFGEEDGAAVALVNRLSNEFSHLESIPDRGFRPVEVPEISRVAAFVLERIYESDKDQYNSLLKSIGEPERVA